MFNIFHTMVIEFNNFFMWYSQPGQLISYIVATCFVCAVVLLLIRGAHV